MQELRPGWGRRSHATDGGATYILQIAQQVRHGLPFVIGQGSFIDALSGSTATQTGSNMTPSVDCRQAGQTGGCESTHASFRPASGPDQRRRGAG